MPDQSSAFLKSEMLTYAVTAICLVLALSLSVWTIEKMLSRKWKRRLAQVDDVFLPLKNFLERRAVIHVFAVAIGGITVFQLLADLNDRSMQREESRQSIVLNAWTQLTAPNLGADARTRAFKLLLEYDRSFSTSQLLCPTRRTMHELMDCRQSFDIKNIIIDRYTINKYPRLDGIRISNSVISEVDALNGYYWNNIELYRSIIDNLSFRTGDAFIQDRDFYYESDNFRIQVKDSTVKNSYVLLDGDISQSLTDSNISSSVFHFTSDIVESGHHENYVLADSPAYYIKLSESKQKKPIRFEIGILEDVTVCDPAFPVSDRRDFEMVAPRNFERCVVMTKEAAVERYPRAYSTEEIKNRVIEIVPDEMRAAINRALVVAP